MKKQKKQEYRALVDFASGNIIGTSTVFTPNAIEIPKIYFDKINQFPHKYMYENGEIVENPEYENILQNKQRQRIAKLHITKFDFFKYICMPHNISYQELEEKIAKNSYLSAAWNLCNHVYRGDETFVKYIKQFIPQITDEELDAVFEKYSERG